MLFPGVSGHTGPGLLVFVESTFVVGAACMALACRRCDGVERSARWGKFVSYVVIVHAMIAVTVRRETMAAVAVLICLGSWVELLRLRIPSGTDSRHRNYRHLTYRALLLCGAAGTILFALGADGRVALFTYIMVAVADAFSQLTGQLAGRTPLAPRISPRKTVEGLAGGLASAVIAGALLHDLADADPGAGALLGLLLGAAGAGGDLIASSCKRFYGIKDFSRFLPGQGGVLDRFNSFLAAAPVMLVITTLRAW